MSESVVSKARSLPRAGILEGWIGASGWGSSETVLEILACRYSVHTDTAALL